MCHPVTCRWNGIDVSATRDVERPTRDDPGSDVIEDHQFSIYGHTVPTELSDWIMGDDDAMEQIDALLREGDDE